MQFETVIGLEIHVELKTRSKMFCSCPVGFGGEPNTRTCPICLGHPGTLPVTNRKAVEYGLMMGLALKCRIEEMCLFHRKNYFYPDMPKNYQISQYDLPLCSGGVVEIETERGLSSIRINRVHMEEDTGKSIHIGAKTGRIHGSDFSMEDFNRAGVPLVEIVTEPDIRSPEEARDFLQELRSIILFLDVSDCRMEEGSLRCDANVSIRLSGNRDLGTKVEIKNMNSFKSLYRAIKYEIERQKELVLSGTEITQETRHWDDSAGITAPLRSKEYAFDYRYFPDPDLVPIHLSEGFINEQRKLICELPSAIRERFVKEYQIPIYDAFFLTQTPETVKFFTDVVSEGAKPKSASNLIMNEITSYMNEHQIEMGEIKITPRMLAELIEMIEEGNISSKQGKSLIIEMMESGRSAGELAKEGGLSQISDSSELEAIAKRVLDENPGPVADYRAGKEKAAGFLVGKMMKETKGTANPKLANQIIERLLSE